MKKNILRNSILFQALALAVLLTAASPASAQEDKSSRKDKESVVVERSNDGDGTDESVRIEIKDGKTWVNGVEVPEGEDVSDYLPEGFDVSILDGERGGRFMVFDNDESREGRYRRFLSSDDGDDDDRVWFDDSDRRFRARRLPNRSVRSGSAFGPGGDDGLRELRENLFEVGGDLGSRAAGFFADFGSSPTSPEIMKLEIESRRLGRELARAEGDSKQKLSAELDELLSSIFDKKTEAREDALSELKAQVRAKEEALASRKRDRQQMIARRKSDLTGESKRNDW